MSFDKTSSLGELTLNLLRDNSVDFVGEPYGINQINGVPVQGKDLK